MRTATLFGALAAFRAATTVLALTTPMAPRTAPPSMTTMPPSPMTLLPRALEKPVEYSIEPWQCLTENLTQYLDVPKPTGSLFKELQSFGAQLYEPCLAAPTLTAFCPFPAQSSWCAFTTAAPSAVLPAYSSYASKAYSWWSAKSSTIISLSAKCPKGWENGMLMNPGSEMWLNNTIAFAGCYSEAYISDKPTTQPTSIPTTTTSKTCTTVSGLVSPTPLDAVCGQRGTSRAAPDTGPIMEYSKGSPYVQSLSACSAQCLATPCCTNFYFIQGTSCNLKYGPSTFNYNVGSTQYDYYDASCFTCGELSCPPTCEVVSRLASPQPSGATCGLKGTSHALQGARTIMGYSADSPFVKSLSACSAECVATTCCTSIYFIQGAACNLHFGPTAFDHNVAVGGMMYDYYDTSCFTCEELSCLNPPTCEVINGLVKPQLADAICGLKGTSHALPGTGTIVGYSAGSPGPAWSRAIALHVVTLLSLGRRSGEREGAGGACVNEVSLAKAVMDSKREYMAVRAKTMIWPRMRSAAAFLVLGPSLVHSAINLDGTQAWAPVSDGDPSPIGDPRTYYPDQHDCPLQCVDYSNMHAWVSYMSVGRLSRCQEPMLLQFSVTQPLDDPAIRVLIRGCTLGSSSATNSIASNSTASRPMENPKKASNLFEASLDTAPACAVNGVECQDKPELFLNRIGSNVYSSDVSTMLEGMRKFFDAKDNCNENFLFAYHKKTVASIYIGAGLGKHTIESATKALDANLQANGHVTNRTVAQLCGSGRQPDQVFGISIDTTGNLAAVQKTALEWSKGYCAANEDLKSVGELSDAKVFDIAKTPMTSANNTFTSNQTSITSRFQERSRARANLFDNQVDKRATCRYIKIVAGDGCASLISRCGISNADFTKYNPSSNLCSTLRAGGYVCCSAGDQYTGPKPEPPKPNADGTCATHLIDHDDTCSTLSIRFGVTIVNLEKFNKGKVWAWTECKDMLYGYNMCISDGKAPLPPPQAGTECGPLVPGTVAPKDASISLADLNPCPLKACCSNWGFCGVFPSHCDIHAPAGGGPGSVAKGFQGTCTSNCGMNIKQNSGPPVAFQRIGYYESYNLERECLWLNAKNANTDGSYTHIHWGFLEIDPVTFKPVIVDKNNQWGQFKNLTNVKRIASFGGWAYSTEPATYNILRSAIIDNADTFTTNLVQFVEDEGIDDILVDGQPIGQKDDGNYYLFFLMLLKVRLGANKSVSIAAPASYWYLKAFPIDRIAAAIDYIVYMTYDLHGQWDYGNVNAFDSCESGKCIRSHVNLTETHNSLAIITKAGVPNNKIFVGEASYGSRTQSDAHPGRCTGTGGYIAYAEINEIIRLDKSALQRRDEDSDTDVLLYQGDYVSYAVDLQAFKDEDMDNPAERPENGEGVGCIYGTDDTVNTAELCEFSCSYGYCPTSLCTCTSMGPLYPLLPEIPNVNVEAHDEADVDLNRLCKFACKFGHCPPDVCTTVTVDNPYDWRNGFDYGDQQYQNPQACLIYKHRQYMDVSMDQCKNYCKDVTEEALANGDDIVMNEIAMTVIEALPIIAQIGCYILMSAFKLVLDLGTDVIPVGKIGEAGLDMATTAAGLASYIYPEGESPEGAFAWWLSPTGSGPGSGSGNGGVTKKKRCYIPPAQKTERLGAAKNTYRVQSCVSDKTTRNEYVITSALYQSTPTMVTVGKECSKANSQACFHYSSVISNNPTWATLTCPQEAAVTGWRLPGGAVRRWESEHKGKGWKDLTCQIDEYPGAYFMAKGDPTYENSGNNVDGQLVRYVPATENGSGGRMWKGACFVPLVKRVSDTDIQRLVKNAPSSDRLEVKLDGRTTTFAAVTVPHRAQFTITAWGQSGNPPQDDGLWVNRCWPAAKAAGDPGFALLDYDQYNDGTTRIGYKYYEAYEKGKNGS
ncbi:hypothetical protein V492_05773 [Pseudogymnoascus sp. VKM F-4246]|nr:hypothetical protein V492_05773 [Pseudogymnoascus sp. VKM F-4246]